MMYDFDGGAIPAALPQLWQGMVLTLQITLVAVLAGIVWGTVLALLRLSKIPLVSLLAAGYVNFFRSVPLVMVLLGFFLVIPQMIRDLFGLTAGLDIRLPLAMAGFALFEAAYYSEIIRAGIQGIRKTQVQAAYALGLSYGQTMRLIILPQAFRNMLPVLLTQAVILFQDTSLVYVGGLVDFFNAAYINANIQHRYVELLLFAGAVYFVLCFGASYGVGRLRARLSGGK
jgi:glutamate/aspartate transport system permease protein